MTKVVLPVTGMSCEHCENAVTQAVSALTGVEKVKASHKKAQVKVVFDETLTSLTAIKAAIIEAGYQA